MPRQETSQDPGEHGANGLHVHTSICDLHPFGKTALSDSSELHQSVLRAVLYGMMELVRNVDGSEVLAHLPLNVPDYYANQAQRDRVVELANYLARKLATSCPDEASAARLLRELVKHQRLG